MMNVPDYSVEAIIASFQIGKYNGFVKSPFPFFRHSGGGRSPKLLEFTGFRIKSGMTKEWKADFLRVHQDCAAEKACYFVAVNKAKASKQLNSKYDGCLCKNG